MNIEALQKRCKKLLEEQRALEAHHATMMQGFREAVIANQTKHAQLCGAIAELKALMKEMEQSKSEMATPSGNDGIVAMRAVC